MPTPLSPANEVASDCRSGNHRQARTVVVGNAAQLVAFERDGYLLLPGMVPKSTCATLAADISASYEALAANRALPDEPGIATGNLNFAAGDAGKPLIEALAAAGVSKLIEQMAGTKLHSHAITGNLNLPGSRPQELHTDSRRDNAFMIANVMLVDCGPENGALELVEGSQAEPLAYWQLQRAPWTVRRRQIVAKQGDVLIRPSTLWHRGTTNPSAQPRPMAAQIFAPQVDLALAPLDGPIAFRGNRYYGRFARAKEVLATHLPALDEALRRGTSRLKGPQ